MEVPLNDDQRRTFEEFLQDLLLVAESEESFDLLLETLLASQENDSSVRPDERPNHGVSGAADPKCHLFKMRPDGVEWVGFVRGTDKTKDVLISLASEESAFYFLYDEGSGEIVDFVQVNPDTRSRDTPEPSSRG